MANICNVCYVKHNDCNKIVDISELAIFQASVKLCIPEIAFTLPVSVFLCTNCYIGLREFNRFRLLCISNHAQLRETFCSGELDQVDDENGFEEKFTADMEKQDDRDSDVDIAEDMEKFIPQVKMEVENDDCVIKLDDLPKPPPPKQKASDSGTEEKKKKPKTHVCGYCNKAFSRSSNLSVHVRHHIGLKPYKCDECNKTFTRQATLIIHKRMHTGDKPYSCQICNKGFIDASHLTKHMKVHSDDRPFVCAVCGKAFARRGDLIKHDRVHTGMKPFKCQICQRGFADHSNLSKHRRVHAK